MSRLFLGMSEMTLFVAVVGIWLVMILSPRNFRAKAGEEDYI